MRANELTGAERAELEAWADDLADRFEAGIEATPGARVPPLVELRRLRYQRRLVDQGITAQVRQARAEGDSWHKIGLALGTTAEAARQRYRAA
ncbi:MAG: hypothetical protein LBC97_12495 [Bifidobacteriaceae bacterium]|jgi:hypothetical protein|nr:hypothetical protein [Bifidobacteriaceae bacterium]